MCLIKLDKIIHCQHFPQWSTSETRCSQGFAGARAARGLATWKKVLPAAAAHCAIVVCCGPEKLYCSCGHVAHDNVPFSQASKRAERHSLRKANQHQAGEIRRRRNHEHCEPRHSHAKTNKLVVVAFVQCCWREQLEVLTLGSVLWAAQFVSGTAPVQRFDRPSCGTNSHSI